MNKQYSINVSLFRAIFNHVHKTLVERVLFYFFKVAICFRMIREHSKVTFYFW